MLRTNLLISKQLSVSVVFLIYVIKSFPRKMRNYFKLFFRRITKDFKQKKLLPLKLLFFMHSSTILVLYPYLTIHMRELGINVEETAIMSAVIPVLAILMPPLAGMLADKIGNFRVLLALFSTAGGASALLLLLVPVGRLTTIYPDRLVFGLSCNSIDQTLELSLSQEQNCLYVNDNNNNNNNSNITDFQLEACGFACHAILTENQSELVINTKKYDLEIYDIEKKSKKTYTYTLSNENFHDRIVSKSMSQRRLQNDERYNTATRKLSKNVYFFPTNGLYNFTCLYKNNSLDNCIFGTRELLNNNQNHTSYYFDGSIKKLKEEHDDIFEERQFYNLYIGKNRSNKCFDGFIKNEQRISITMPIYQSKNSTEIDKILDLGTCSTRCLITTLRKRLCSNDKKIVDLNMKLTFWSYLSARVCSGILSGTSFAMFEGAVIAILREHKADYGLQRIYATIGGMISSPLSGFLIDIASRGKGYTDFTPIFCLYATMKIGSAILILFIDLEFKKPAKNVIAEVFAVLQKVELIALFIACLIMGCAWGYIESFLFWLLQDLGGSKSLMGLTITVGGLVGIPLLVLSGPIIKKIGHANVIVIGFIFYAIRLVGYSLIYNPWLSLLFEAMESITIGLSFTAAVTYAAKLSTITTDSTIQGMLGGLYYGFGKGVGSLIGGYLIKSFGIRSTFQKFAIFIGITGLIYFAFHHLYMKKRPSSGCDITKKDSLKVSPSPQQQPQPPQSSGFVDIDLGTKIDVVEIPAMYEDALTNPAFEDTEMDDNNELNKITDTNTNQS